MSTIAQSLANTQPSSLDELEQSLVKSGIFVEDKIYFTRLVSLSSTPPTRRASEIGKGKIAETKPEATTVLSEAEKSDVNNEGESTELDAGSTTTKPIEFDANRIVAAKSIKIDENLLIHKALRIFLLSNGLIENSLSFEKLIPLTKYLNSKNPENINRNSLRKILKFRHFKIHKNNTEQTVSLNDTLYNQLTKQRFLELPNNQKTINVRRNSAFDMLLKIFNYGDCESILNLSENEKDIIDEYIIKFKKQNVTKKNIMRIENLLVKEKQFHLSSCSCSSDNESTNSKSGKSIFIANKGKILTTNQLIYYFKELIGLELNYNELYFKIKEVLRVKNKLIIRVLDTKTGEFGHMLNGDFIVYYS